MVKSYLVTSATDSADAEEEFDIAVIGAGVVGCACARRFTLAGARVVVLERAPDLLAGASKGNSAILHTGFDAPRGSLELDCMRAGYREYLAIRDELGLPILRTGALVVAWDRTDLARLEEVAARAAGNGVDDAERVDGQRLKQIEPGLAPGALAAVRIPGESIIDPWSAPLAYLRQACDNGAVAMFDREVAGGVFDGAAWRLECSNGDRVRAATVVNCAGLHGDRIDQRLLGTSTFTVRPRKGQFVVFDKAAAPHVRHIVLPPPTEQTKGVLVSRTIFGNVLVGPTAEDQDERDVVTVDAGTLSRLRDQAAALVPALKDMPVTAVYAGLRPATESKEYRIVQHADRNWVTVGGIRSTGLTAALGIAQYVLGLYETAGNSHEALAAPVHVPVPNLAEHEPRVWQTPDHGEIVCHCEMVTRREIESALEGPLPARDLAGLKRRTRATMGRCQGFYCTARLAQITRGRMAAPIAGEITDS